MWSSRPGEVRLGPGHADHPGDCARIHHEAPQGQENFKFENIPLDDYPTYKLFQDGKTEAVFQFESRGMQGMLATPSPRAWKT
jgi:DNA polymerase III alpha subunit